MGREKSNATLPRNSDRVRLDARGIQTPDLEATSRCRCRIPTALSAVEKKKANKTSPRIHPRVLSHHLLCAQGTKPELHQRYPFEI